MTQEPGATGRPPADQPWWGEPWSGDAGPTPVDPPAPPVPVGGGPPRGSGHLRAGALVLIAVVAVLSGGAGAAIGVSVGRSTGTSTGGTTAAAISPRVSAASDPNQSALEAVAAAVSPTVVLVTETFGNTVGTGSGVVIDAAKGYILTNNHVVSGVATGGGTLTVTTQTGRTAPATVVGRDPTADIAVIRVSLPGLTQARLGNSAAVKVGETVLAFGAPLGLQGTVTSGIVSALNRPVSTQDTSTNTGTPTLATIDAIQTDAAINPGNSGGALVDLSGDVIGINSAIASVSGAPDGGSAQAGNIGVGFAIPVNEARDTAQQIIATGHAVHAVIGVSLAASQGPTASGAVVRSVTPGGPAAKAGIAPGDVLVAVDGMAIPDADAAVVAIRANHKPGDTVKITISRNGQQRTVSVTLGASAPS